MLMIYRGFSEYEMREFAILCVCVFCLSLFAIKLISDSTWQHVVTTSELCELHFPEAPAGETSLMLTDLRSL